TVASTLVAGPVLAPDLLASKGSFAPARPEARLLAPLTSMVSRLICAVVGIGHDDVADAAGVRLTRYPPGLVSALEKLSAGSTVVASASKATAHMWLASPLPTSRFDTHLPLEPRINALKEL
ncbi:MAG: hypothetical protein ACRDY5_10330, partial [Acidimicrobiales bacterium]